MAWRGLPLVAPAFRFGHANYIGALQGLAIHCNARVASRRGARKRHLVAILQECQRMIELL